MKADWKALAEISMSHLGSTVGSTASAVGIGLLVGIALCILFWKLGLFRRPVNKWYNGLAKLWIPFILVVCMMIGGQIGLYRSVYRSVIASNDAAMAALYESALGPALGTPEKRQAFLQSVQASAKDGQNLGKAFTTAIKDLLHSRIPQDRTMAEDGAVLLADWAIEHYEDDIASAILYGIYLKTGGHLQLHSNAGEPMEYGEFHDNVEQLLKIDLGQMEAAIKGNLGGLTHGLIESQYKGMVKGALLMGLLLVLLPVIEWAIYTLVMKRKLAVPAPATVPPVEPDVLKADDL
ncbi:MAG: hypothetical protein IPP26_12360 [Flavobacteriales bacterium]|nr:hypothetical protein [Flavobacteriales bacterium]